jgi:hypothetical protein
MPIPTPKPKITKPICAVNNKTTHFHYDASFVAFAQTFKPEDFNKLAIKALSAITPDIESDHKRTCHDFVLTIRLWFKTVNYLQHISPKTLQQQIQLGFLTQPDQTDLLAQFMLDHVKRCNHCMYICMACLNKQATEPVLSITQNHSIPLTDIIGRIYPDPVEQFHQLKLQEQHQAHQQLLQQHQFAPITQGTSLPPNQTLHQAAQPHTVQQQQYVVPHFHPLQQMAQHHFLQQPHFIAQIHPQFLVTKQRKNQNSHYTMQQPGVIVKQQHPTSN